MKTCRLYQVDSFTRERFHGNPAGVVPNADGLSEEQMQRIAREHRLTDDPMILSSGGLLHALVGVPVAQEKYGMEEEDFLSAENLKCLRAFGAWKFGFKCSKKCVTNRADCDILQ